MDLLRLKYFYAVAKEGGFVKAAKVLRVQQPAISKMVRQLEESLELTLFERHKRGVKLTQVGTEIYKKCQTLFDQVDAIHALADSQQEGCQGSLSIGATDSVASYVLPQLLGKFLRHHPKVEPSLFAGTSNLICREISEDRIEFGVFFTVPEGDFKITDIAEVPFELVGPKNISVSEAIALGFVLSREIDYPKHRPFPVLEMLRANQIPVNVAITSNNLDAQKQLVMEGLGVALLPSFMVRKEVKKGQLQNLFPKKSFRYSLKVVTRKRKVLSKSAATFLQFLETELPGLTSSTTLRD
jgi:DNA-binding transcriptional LysR family regulator